MLHVEIRIDEDSVFPSILELKDSIDEIKEDPIDISWSNSRNEVFALRSFPDRHFILHVDDFPAKDKATATLGLPLSPPQPALERAKNFLVEQKTYDWRNFCEDNKGGPAPKYLLLKLVADQLRKGNQPVLADIIEPLFLDGIRQEDVDVLLRLKALR
jgi:hypothetical protein